MSEPPKPPSFFPPAPPVPPWPTPPARTDSPFSEILSALLAQQSKHIRDRDYRDQIVPLDGYTFTNCGFNGCTLRTDTGAFEMKDCLVWNCKIEFGPNAVRIIKLWNVFNQNIQWPNFNPQRNPDGSVTIP